MEPAECAELFARLRERTTQLKELPRLGQEFLSWHKELLKAVQGCFGEESPELKEMRSIPFEIPAWVSDHWIGFLSNPLALEDLHQRQFLKDLDRVHNLLQEYILVHSRPESKGQG